MEILRLKGTVFSGEGEGARFVNLAWARKQVEEKLGFSPYPGTLNVKLTGSSIERKRMLTKAVGLDVSPAHGYYPGKLFRASLMNLECAVIIPKVPGYPKDVIEVVSPKNLRETLHLVDGSLCEVLVAI